MNFELKLNRKQQKKAEQLSWNDLTYSQRGDAESYVRAELFEHKMAREGGYSDAKWKSLKNRKHYLLKRLESLGSLNLANTNDATAGIYIFNVGAGFFTPIFCTLSNEEFLEALGALSAPYKPLKGDK